MKGSPVQSETKCIAKKPDNVKLRFLFCWDTSPRRWVICYRRTTSVSRKPGNRLPPCRQGSNCSMDVWALKDQTTSMSRKFRNSLPVTRRHTPEERKTQPHRWKKKPPHFCSSGMFGGVGRKLVCYWRCGINYRSHLQRSATKYRHMPRNIQQERRPQSRRGGNLKSHINTIVWYHFFQC